MLIAVSRRHRPGVLLTPGQPHFSIVIPEFVVIPEGNLRFTSARAGPHLYVKCSGMNTLPGII